MTHLFYKEWNPKPASAILVSEAETIIEEYDDDGYTLTLRQLYYQFVARGIIENSERSYKNLGTLVTKARMAGMISWDAIEDRNRKLNTHYFQEDDSELIGNLSYYIGFDQWARQDTYVEVWVEKEALGNVVERACSPLLVPHLSCKGYLSSSEAWRAGRRFEDKLAEGKHCVMIHLGDHDPSGIDMTRDNAERLELFARAHGEIEIARIALNMDQVDDYSPPPNPTKFTDSRAREYSNKYGSSSWELDALEPSVMRKLITDEVKKHIDVDLWDQTTGEEDDIKSIFLALHEQWESVKQGLM